MFKLGDITVSRKLILLLALAFVGFVSLLLISANALQRNLMSEREARLNAVLEQAMSQISGQHPASRAGSAGGAQAADQHPL